MKTFDWVATKLETWEKKVKKISDQITDYITSALKTSLLKKQMKTMNYEMKANTKGELAYMKKANSVAEKYTYYNSDGGEINVPISCGGISVNPGDIVVMDDDGVIIIPLKDASAVLAAAQKLQETDEAKVVAAGNGTAKREWVAKAIETKKIEIIDDYY